MKKFFRIIAELVAEGTDTDIDLILSKLEIPTDDKLGDIAFPCFLPAKHLHKSPQDIAMELASTLKPPSEISSISADGPYLNFKLSRKSVVEEILSEVRSKRERYGSSDDYVGQTVVMDFSSPNIAKPFGLGHLRSTVIGNSLMRIYRFCGYKAVGINHLGDWGTQFGKLICAYNLWGDKDKLKEDPISELYRLYVKFHKEAEGDPSLMEKGREWFRKLEDGDEYALTLWKHFKEYSMAEFDKIYDRLGINFDFQTGESFYNDKIPAVINRLKDKKLAETSEDALVVKLDKYDMPPLLLKKKDETTLYATRDLAAAIYRYDTFSFDKLFYIVGSEQKLHFRQLFKVLELMGYKWADNCYHIEFGRIKFEGEEMSTRKGNIILLEDVIGKSKRLALKIIEGKNPDIPNKDDVAEQIGLGAVIFAQFSSRRIKNISFSWEEALNFDGRTGPYLQYTHARLCSLERKDVGEMPTPPNLNLLTDQREFSICKLIGRFPIIIKSALSENEPSLIASYLLELASEFNGYYQNVRILVEDKELKSARMALSGAVKIIIKIGLNLLGISSPERM